MTKNSLMKYNIELGDCLLFKRDSPLLSYHGGECTAEGRHGAS